MEIYERASRVWWRSSWEFSVNTVCSNQSSAGDDWVVTAGVVAVFTIAAPPPVPAAAALRRRWLENRLEERKSKTLS